MDPTLIDSLSLVGGGVVSLVGGGGKTTLMFRLAGELADAGWSVLTTTTTKILRPHAAQSAHVVVAPDPQTAVDRFDALQAGGCRHMTAVRGLGGEPDKLVGYNPDQIGRLHRSGRFDWIVVEADGAKRRPLKAPADHEPVVPRETGWVVAVVGLSCMGRPLDERWVFRCRRFGRITGLAPGAPVTIEAVARAAQHPDGLLKGAPEQARRALFLNQADDRLRRETGRKLARHLESLRPCPVERVLVGALQSRQAVDAVQPCTCDDIERR